MAYRSATSDLVSEDEHWADMTLSFAGLGCYNTDWTVAAIINNGSDLHRENLHRRGDDGAHIFISREDNS
jgi:hypothetical protein